MARRQSCTPVPSAASRKLRQSAGGYRLPLAAKGDFLFILRLVQIPTRLTRCSMFVKPCVSRWERVSLNGWQCTGSLSEVKRWRARLVLFWGSGWDALREDWVVFDEACEEAV